MTKAELIRRLTVAADGRLTRKQTERLMDAVFDHVREAIVSEGKFAYPDFGTWVLLTRRSRRAHNPRTRTDMQVPEQQSIAFRPAAALKGRTPKGN